MDINLVRYLGRDKNNRMITEDVEDEFNWDDTRYTIRHRFNNEIEFMSLDNNTYGDFECISRPKDFKEAYKWMNTLEGGERDYIETILDILFYNNDLYLEFNW